MKFVEQQAAGDCQEKVENKTEVSNAERKHGSIHDKAKDHRGGAGLAMIFLYPLPIEHCSSGGRFSENAFLRPKLF